MKRRTRRVPQPGGETVKRWTRFVRCAIGIAQTVNRFKWVENGE
jgi:hypothetical protein